MFKQHKCYYSAHFQVPGQNAFKYLIWCYAQIGNT